MQTSTPPDIAQVLACPTLPSLPAVGLQVLELTRKADASVEQIARLVETDPGLSAKVLKTVNSSLYALKDPCTTIRRALGYLGMAAVKSLVLGFSLIDSGKGIPSGAGTAGGEYWKRAIFAAASSRVIALECRACDPDEAFTAALFQDLGVLAMLATINDAYAAAVASDPTNHPVHCELEMAALGFTHTQVGGELASRWRLPPAYAQAVRFHHEPEQAAPEHRGLVRVVAMSGTLATALTVPNGSAHLPLLLAQARDWFTLDVTRVKAMMSRVAPAARELAHLFEKPVGKLPNLQDVMAQASEEMLLNQVSVLREAEELRARNRALKVEAETDALTGLFNRKKFEQQFPGLIEQAKASRRPLALAMVDGDRFKSVNDTHGHPAGDAVLRELAARLTRSIGATGSVYRLGGEEFAILLPDQTIAEAELIADAARRVIAGTPFDISGAGGKAPTLNFTASFGIAAFQPDQSPTLDTPALLVETADRALYQAKHNGRNRVYVERPGAPVALTAAAPPTAASAARPSTPAPAAPSPSAGAPRTYIILIEDDALAAKLLITLFRKTGTVDVEWLRDGTAAVQRIEQLATAARKPDVVLTDYRLPGTDGPGIVRAIRSRPAFANLPVVVMSATFDQAASQACQHAGATALLNKSDLALNLQDWVARITSGQFTGMSGSRAA